MRGISEAIETAELWLDLWEDDQAELDEVDECDIEERKVILAMRAVIKRAKAAPVLLAALESIAGESAFNGLPESKQAAIYAAIDQATGKPQ